MSAKLERPRRKLPTGMQTFRETRDDDCYYVDKTAFIGRFVCVSTKRLLPKRRGRDRK